MKPYLPTIVCCVALIGAAVCPFAFEWAVFGVPLSLAVLFAGWWMAYLVKAKEDRVFDGSNIDEIAALVAEKIGLKISQK